MLRVQFQQECKFVPTQWVVVWLGQNHHTNCPPHQLKVATSALGTSLHTAFATHSIQLAIGNPYSSRNLQQCLLKRALLNPAKHFNFDFCPMATSSRRPPVNHKKEWLCTKLRAQKHKPLPEWASSRMCILETSLQQNKTHSIKFKK